MTSNAYMATYSIDEEDLLFKDLLAAEALPIPASLACYAVDPVRPEVRREGRRAFLRWLYARLTDGSVSTPRSLMPTACMDQVDLFATQQPNHEDVDNAFYGYRPDSSTFRKATHRAVVQAATARRLCFACPLREACLDDSVVNFRKEDVGIFGGYDERIRKQFRDHFERMRRTWNKNRISAEERLQLLTETEELHKMPKGALVALDEERRARGVTTSAEDDVEEDVLDLR